MLLALLAGPLAAGEVRILDAELSPQADGRWRAAVTLRHADTGWEHYADAWRVVGPHGRVLAERTLHHPHVDEQPFTRALRDIDIPARARAVHIEARDIVHGWSPQRLRVELPAHAGAPE